MPTSSQDCYVQFFRQIQQGTWTINNISRAFNNGHIVQRDLEQSYNAVFLQSVIAFELLIEDIFYGLLTNRVDHPRGSAPWQCFPSIEIAKQIVLQGRGYVDWLPIDNLYKRSDIYFQPTGNPFRALTAAERAEIKKVLLIRNVIAHKSEHAISAFNTEVIGPTAVPNGQRRLLKYFRYPHTPTVTKFEYHIGQLVNAARTIST